MVNMVMYKRILFRRSIRKFFLRRWKYVLPVILITVCWLVWLTILRRNPWTEEDFVQFKRSRNLHYYLNRTKTLIEPTTSPCPERSEINLVVLVVSAPTNRQRRAAIRGTWGNYFKTIYFMGVTTHRYDDLLITLYVEAKRYNDLVVFDFIDHYQNLTIKTGLILNWILKKCPETYYTIYKVDDDVVLNPWAIKEILRENKSAKLMGYLHSNAWIYRGVHSKWYQPRWLCNEVRIPQYLGCSYIIKGMYIKSILDATNVVPMHNLEDIYYTYHVAHKQLKYELTGDARLYGEVFLPYLRLCNYFCYKAIYGECDAHTIKAIWAKVYKLGKAYEAGIAVCEFCG